MKTLSAVVAGLGERLYLVILIADVDGEATMEGLVPEEADGIAQPGAVQF